MIYMINLNNSADQDNEVYLLPVWEGLEKYFRQRMVITPGKKEIQINIYWPNNDRKASMLIIYTYIGSVYSWHIWTFQTFMPSGLTLSSIMEDTNKTGDQSLEKMSVGSTKRRPNPGVSHFIYSNLDSSFILSFFASLFFLIFCIYSYIYFYIYIIFYIVSFFIYS